MTMRELATLAGVAVSTVSKAFCDADDISPETKKKIITLAKEYGCYQKFYKGKHPKKTIAIICSELESNYFIRFVEQLQKIIEANNCIPIIATDHFNAKLQSELIEYFSSYHKVDGILIFGLLNKVKKEYTTPIVSLFSTVDSSVDSVAIDFQSAIIESIKLLTNFGHKKIAYIGESLTRTKANYFQRAMVQIGVKDPYIIESNYRFEKAGQDGIKKLLANTTGYTAIICAYDNIAYGAMKQLHKLGFDVPNDFSIIGIDNIDTSEHTDTTLSSIGINIDEFCMVVWNLLWNKMNSKKLRNSQKIVINSSLIIRESIKNLKPQ